MFSPSILVAIVTWVKILLQSVHIQEEVVQLGDASRGFDRHADRYKVS